MMGKIEQATLWIVNRKTGVVEVSNPWSTDRCLEVMDTANNNEHHAKRFYTWVVPAPSRGLL